jgi:ketosteroid isomerase-like protein
MPESNVDRLRAGYEALDRGDIGPVRDFLHPEAEMHDRPEIPDATTYRGWEGIVHSVRASEETFDDFHFLPEQFLENDDKIVVIIRMVGKGRASGVPVEERIAHLWTVRDGRGVVLRAYSSPADALEAAGLSRELAEATEGPQSPAGS